MENATPSPQQALAAARPAGKLPRAIRRALAFIALAFWFAAFLLLWLHAPRTARILSLAWAALGLAAPNLYLISLAAALPFFGDNPGGGHFIYLLDMGLMGFVVRDLAARIMRPRGSDSAPEDSRPALLAFIFLLISLAALMPQHRHFYCEIKVYGSDFLYNAFTHHATSPIYGLRAWVNLALSVCVFAALRDRPPESRWRKYFWFALLGALAVSSLLGVLEYMRWISLAWWRPENPLITRFGYRRLQSLFWHSGWFGQYLAAVAPATLAFAAVEKNIRRRAAWLALAGFLGFTQLLTMQRGEWLAFLAGCAAIGGSLILASAGDSRRKIIRRAIAVAGGAFLFVFLLAAAHTPLRHRIGEMVQVRDRWTIWSGGLHLAGKFPSAGIGLGNYSVMHHVSFDEDNPLSLADDRTTAHNVYIHVFAERGIYAILFFLLLFWGTIWSLLRTSVAGGGTGFERAERLALLGGLTALAVDGVFQYTFYIRMTEVLFWIFLAFALPRSAKCDLPGFIPRRAARIWALIGIAIFSYLIYYQRFYFHYLNRVNGGEEGIFKVAGSEVSLPLPRDAHHISLRVISKDPSLPQDAVTFAFWIGDQLIATQVLHDHTAVDVPLPLPAGRDPAIPLTIKSSRAWRPYEQSFRRLPIVEAGVCYQDPRVVD